MCAYDKYFTVLNYNDIACAWARIEFKLMIIYWPCFEHRYVASARVVSVWHRAIFGSFRVSIL